MALISGTGQAAGPSVEELTQSGDPQQLLEWGKRHFYGVKAPQSIDSAILLYCAAARLGSGEAQFRLGDIYAGTAAGKKDEVLAAAWLLKAALSKYQAAKPRLAQWDLTNAELTPEPECVLSAQMVVRILPRSRPAATAPSAAPEQPKRPVTAKLAANPKRHEVERLVRELAPTYALSPELVLAVIEVESNYDAGARSPKQAQGLMQLIPATAKRFGVSDPWDPHQNVRGGMAYLRWLLDHFDGDLRLALAGYNAGEEAVRRHGGVPPYSETQNYVRRIARVLGVSEEGLGSVETRPAQSTATRRSPGRRVDSDWESRFFEVDTSG
jgi:soluble lytic murein transglycosylase-like protein